MLDPQWLALGLALATDAAVVCFTLGLLNQAEKRRTLILRGLLAAGLMGLFQFLMLWLGSFGGYYLSFSHYGHHYPYVVASIFIVIAFKLFHDSITEEKEPLTWVPFTLLVLALGTSIDALGAGVSFGTFPQTYLIAADIGIVTFLLCSLFYHLARIFKRLPERWLLRLSGVVFLGLAVNILKGFV